MAPQDPAAGASNVLSRGGTFPEPDYAQWQEQVEKVLRKTGLLGDDVAAPDPVEDVLASVTHDGVTVHPLYTDNPTEPGYPGAAPFVRGSDPHGNATEGWDVRQQHGQSDAAATNRDILADLGNGVTSLWLRLGTGGLPVDGLGDALSGVHVDMIGLALDAGAETARAANAFLQLAEEQGVQRSSLRGSLGADPIGVRARTGEKQDFSDAVELAQRCAKQYPNLRAMTVSGLPYHDAGGSDAEELGCTLAAAVANLRELADHVDIDAACNTMEFRYAATNDQFSTIAKLRAARRLWERVTRECGAGDHARRQQQHAVTSSAMLTRRDPWSNLLRATIGAFSAGVGGAQAVTVQPFDAAIGLPDTNSLRIARNTQLLLLEESRLAQVIDPAGGSWYVETLTDDLARAAWEWFQRIEAEGGMVSALESGLVADRLAATRQQRQSAIAHRSDPITGVSEFPNLDEQPLQRPALPSWPAGGLPRFRWSEGYEALRDASDSHQESTGSRPRVFLATLGPVAAHTARAAFTKNLLAAGGIDTSEAGATGPDEPGSADDTVQDVVEAFLATGDSVACLCGTNDAYRTYGEEAVTALKQAGAHGVLLAGPRKMSIKDVDDYVFSGVDALAVLRELHRTLGVQQ